MFNLQTTPIGIDTKYIEVSSISENGKYIIFTGYRNYNFAIFDIQNNIFIKLYDQNHNELQDKFDIKFTQVANNGTAIGFGIPKNSKSDLIYGIFCQPANPSSEQCFIIDSQNDNLSNMLMHISSNSQWIYGIQSNRNSITTIYQIKFYNNKFIINPINELVGFTIDNISSNITDTGLMTVVKQNSPQFQYIYVPNQHQLYSIIDLIKALNITNTTGRLYLTISHNGKYIYCQQY
jgi:hypothetical protein